MFLPQAVTQNGELLLAGRRVFLRECAPQRRSDTERVEILGRHTLAVDSHRRPLPAYVVAVVAEYGDRLEYVGHRFAVEVIRHGICAAIGDSRAGGDVV